MSRVAIDVTHLIVGWSLISLRSELVSFHDMASHILLLVQPAAYTCPAVGLRVPLEDIFAS